MSSNWKLKNQKSKELDQNELELEIEEPEEQEFELRMDNDDKVEEFANRFYELSTRTFESEVQMDNAVDSMLNEMEQEFFFKKLGEKLKKAGKGLIKKGLNIVGKVISKSPIGNVVKGVTQIARGNIKGALGSLAKGALQTLVPGAGSAAVAAADALGFEVGNDQMNKQAWKRYVLVSRETYDYLAENLEEDSDEPEKATVLAAKAVQHGLRQYAGRRIRRRHPGRYGPKRKAISLRPGQAVRIKGKDRNIIIKRKRDTSS